MNVRPPLLLWFGAGAASAGLSAALAALLVVETGLFDARASTPHDPLTAWATHTTMIHSVERGSAKITAPTAFTPAQTQAGFRIYDAECVACHGAPAMDRVSWAKGLNPSPPYLLDAARQWSPGELYRIIRDGVKMTAMPAWDTTLSDAQVWDCVGFLEALPYLSAADLARMREAGFVGANRRTATPE
jgi:mono/diheme cytochrome c family protein